MSARSRVLVSTADQVLSSMSNALVVFSLARVMSVSEFGVAALLFGIITAAIGLTRGAAGTPLLLLAGSPIADIRREASFSVSATAMFALVVAVLAGATGVLLGNPSIGLAFAVASPLVLVQDVLRFTAVSASRPVIALIWDGIWTAGSLALLVATWIRPNALTATEIAWGWTLFGGVAAVGIAISLRVAPRLQGLGGWLRGSARTRIQFGIENGIEQLSAMAVVAIASVVVGTVAAATLRGAGTLLGPLAILIGALPLVVIPESIRAGHDPKRIWSNLCRVALFTSTCALAIGFLGPMVPQSIGQLVLGSSWGAASSVLPLLGIEYAAVSWLACVYSLLKSQGMSAQLVRARAFHAVATIGISTIATLVWPTAAGVACGLALSAFLVTAILVHLARPRSSGRHRATEIPRTPHAEELHAALRAPSRVTAAGNSDQGQIRSAMKGPV